MNAISALLNGIVQLITTLTGLFATADRGISMLDKAVTTAAAKQRITVALDMTDFRSRTKEEIGMRATERRLRVNAFTADPERNAVYRQVMAELDSALAEADKAEAEAKK